MPPQSLTYWTKPISYFRKFPELPSIWAQEFYHHIALRRDYRYEIAALTAILFSAPVIFIVPIIRLAGKDTIFAGSNSLDPHQQFIISLVAWCVHLQLLISSSVFLLLKKRQTLKDQSSVYKRSKRSAYILIIGIQLFLGVMFLIVWPFLGINTPFIVGIFIYVTFFYFPNRINFYSYLVYCLVYLIIIIIVPQSFPYQFNAIITGIGIAFIGWVLGELLFEGELKDFLNRKNLEQQALELSQAYSSIAQLNDQLQSENSRMSTELDIARELQSIILPKPEELRHISFLDIASFMSPATEVGGDYFDVLMSAEDHKVTLAIADVTGHGLESGIFTIMVQTAVRMLHNLETSPLTYSLDILNRLLFDNAKRMGSDKCMTFLLLSYCRGHIKLCGQHEEIILVRHNGIVERIDTIDLGFPLGLEADISDFVAETEISLASGDVLILYTDGITEAVNPDQNMYGINRLCETIQAHYECSAQEICQSILDHLMAFIGSATIRDDITLVVLKQL